MKKCIIACVFLLSSLSLLSKEPINNSIIETLDCLRLPSKKRAELYTLIEQVYNKNDITQLDTLTSFINKKYRRFHQIKIYKVLIEWTLKNNPELCTPLIKFIPLNFLRKKRDIAQLILIEAIKSQNEELVIYCIQVLPPSIFSQRYHKEMWPLNYAQQSGNQRIFNLIAYAIQFHCIANNRYIYNFMYDSYFPGITLGLTCLSIIGGIEHYHSVLEQKRSFINYCNNINPHYDLFPVPANN